MATNVPLANIKGQMSVRRKGDSKCSVHRNKELVIHCSDCVDLICISCSISNHSHHKQEELSDVTPRNISVLQRYINDTENGALLKLRDEIESVEIKLTKNYTDFENLDEKVKQQGVERKKHIDTLIEEFVSNNAKLRDQNRDLLKKYKEELQERYNTVVKQMEECKQVIQSGTPVQVYDETSNISVDVPTPIPPEPILCEVDIRPCTSICEKLDNVFGSLINSFGQEEREAIRQEEFLDKSIVTLQFQSTIDSTSINPVSSGVWLSGCDSRKLSLVDFKGQSKTKIKHQCIIQCTAVSSNTNDIWFGCFRDSAIYEKISGLHVPVKCFTTDSWPLCLCISKEEHVVVGSLYNITIYTTTGQVVATISVSKDLQGMQCLAPGSISQSPVTSNFAVSFKCKQDDDYLSGKLVVYDKTLEFMFEYSRREDNVPWKAVYDSRGNLVVATAYACATSLQLFDGSGQYLRTVYVTTNEITDIGITLDDVLWISVYAEKSRQFSKKKKMNIKTIEYYKPA